MQICHVSHQQENKKLIFRNLIGDPGSLGFSDSIIARHQSSLCSNHFSVTPSYSPTKPSRAGLGSLFLGVIFNRNFVKWSLQRQGRTGAKWYRETSPGSLGEQPALEVYTWISSKQITAVGICNAESVPGEESWRRWLQPKLQSL